MKLEKQTLYVVATPIGNLDDLSIRARDILLNVDCIAAEDTRHSSRLLQHYAIDTPCVALHEHNERKVMDRLLHQVETGQNLALISDAGTPLLSDPGYHLVREARNRGIQVVPVPGACALITALSASGLPTDCFHFDGFLPTKSAARCKRLASLKDHSCTLIFYESPHRIQETVHDMASVFGAEREVVLARELTKTYETIHSDTLAGLVSWLEDDPNQRRGEMVILLHGCTEKNDTEITPEVARVLSILRKALPVKQAASLASEITGVKKNRLYQFAITEQTEE